jgi:hypothetical protein
MEELFPGYRKFNNEEFLKLWVECIFVVDTNVLLNLYRYKISTRDELLKLLDEIKDRIWIPHQVALEFHDKRLNVINSLISAYDKIIRLEESNYDKINEKLKDCKERHPVIDVDKIIAVLDKNYKSMVDEIEKEKSVHPDWNANDDIKDKIYSIFNGRVGEPYSQNNLEEIYRRGALRYSLKIPPGYEDMGEKKEFPYKEYGDLVLWCQLIDESRRIKKPIVFVTDETKKDWWTKKGSSTPCPELIQEFFLETGNLIYIYSPKNFMKRAQEFLKLTIAQDAIKEIEDVKEWDEKHFGDLTNKKLVFSFEEIDPIPKSEYEKIGKLREYIHQTFFANPKMTEDEANQLAFKFDKETVLKHNIRIIIENVKEEDSVFDAFSFR